MGDFQEPSLQPFTAKLIRHTRHRRHRRHTLCRPGAAPCWPGETNTTCLWKWIFLLGTARHGTENCAVPSWCQGPDLEDLFQLFMRAFDRWKSVMHSKFELLFFFYKILKLSLLTWNLFYFKFQTSFQTFSFSLAPLKTKTRLLKRLLKHDYMKNKFD